MFTCEASGSTPISYRWLYNGNDVMDDPGHIEGANTNTLMIVNVTVTDWGMYSCVASNIVDNGTSNEATLHGECLSVCVCVYVCVCMSMCVYACMSVCVCACVRLYVWVDVGACIHACALREVHMYLWLWIMRSVINNYFS